MKKFLAYYLPQFHPIPENDAWWGKGFTEWTNVAKAKPLFKGHNQPFLPADLGYYDLRLTETQQQQEDLALEYGVDGFCYWYYWFGGGKTILETPLKNKLKYTNLKLPFNLAWANETWSRRWVGSEKQVLIQQEYLGREDYEKFFYETLPYFKDERYIRIDGNVLFSVYLPYSHPDIPDFLNLWRELASRNGLAGIHFNAINALSNALDLGFDSFSAGSPNIKEELVKNNILNKLSLRITDVRLTDYLKNFPNKGPNLYSYKHFVDSHFNEELHEREFPVVVTGWDNTPRKKRRGTVLINSSPELFEKHLQKAFQAIPQNTENEERVLFIKSWNEWAEGNVLEPSMQFGRGYLEAVKTVRAIHI